MLKSPKGFLRGLEAALGEVRNFSFGRNPSRAKSNPHAERMKELVDHLLSADVQVPLPLDIDDVPAKLTQDEVKAVFIEHVPGVERFLYRMQPEVRSLQFCLTAYQDGLAAYRGTPAHEQLVRLMRYVVHQAHEGNPEAALHLREVAEAFQECQAAQARAIQRVGLRMHGVPCDLKGLVTNLVGEYKSLAIRMCAAQPITWSSSRKGKSRHQTARARSLSPWQTPRDLHYENRLITDLGDDLGLDAAEVRQAQLDEHASTRYRPLSKFVREAVLQQCREFFDMPALLQAFTSEANSFSADSPEQSLPRIFIDWSSNHICPKHVVLDEETCSKVQINDALALAVLETLFFGEPKAPPEEMYQGRPINSYFSLQKDMEISI